MRVESGRRATYRLVIDTNVWISGALNPAGAPGRLTRLALAAGVPIFSPDTFAELETRLMKPKFDRYVSRELRQGILHDLGAAADWVEIPASLATQTYCRDPDDDKFIHTALAARASWIVSGDQDLLDLSVTAVPDVRIVTPADALDLLPFAVGS
ncbi:putative toxin-antitoxin system toxin component, PIN family [Thiorhodococcus minor]|uniref:Putative toxin-antitoxin system toxin component, PIN family n=1 Tax=Thiorhodococcus minor TaxID=57489 RepID=A0A6M0K329_9GAMM|nr:putative toxin-antitoxin system toxin component, PIN family [Thiorhodococcus minor]NEV63779.1 putative toxin-antitoxin system toxin component, PIN family [Thiorhodococcus minor]